MASDLRLLYVDDESALLEIGKLFLEYNGEFEVDTLTSAKDALDRVKSVQYEAIISDYQMPDMDGILFLKQLRASGNTTPFIIFTGRGREEIVIEALNEGAAFYIQKGGEPKSQFVELAHKIRQAIQQRRSLASIRNHERREADIINFLPDATFAIDINGVVIAWNRAIERMTGIGSNRILGKGDHEYALPFYHEHRPMLIDLVLQDDPVASGKYQPITRDGTTLVSEITIPTFNNGEGTTFWFTASPLYDLGGTVVGAIESIRETTERKRADEALAWSEKRFRELSDLLPQIVYEMDPNGTLTYTNHIAYEQFGYSEDEVRQGLNVIQMLAPIDQDRAGADIRRMVEGQERTRSGGEYLAMRKNGSTFPITIYSSPVVVDDRIAGVRGIIVDMTERKQAEEALRQSDLLLHEVFDNANDAIFLLERTPDGPGKYLLVNDKAVRMLGYSKEEFLQMSPRDIVPEDVQKRIMPEVIQELLREGHATFESVHRRKDGSTYPIEVSTHTFRYRGKDVDLSIIRDITERKRTQEALTESEEKFRNIIAQANDGVMLVDETGSIQVWNRSLQSMTGLSEEEVIGRAVWDIQLQLIPQRTREIPGMYNQIKDGYLSHFKEEESTWVNLSQVHEIFRPDGTSRVIQMFTFSIKKDRKNLVCAFARDITEQKHAEDALRQANRKLTLLSGITRHDINNQMTVLQGYLALLDSNQLSPVYAGYCRKAGAAAERISAMIQFTREYESIGVHAPVWQDCRTLVETAAGQVPLGQIVVKNSIPAGFEVFADPLIIKVCYNLMDNAVRYGRKVTTIRFSVEERDGASILVCDDDGDGVSAEDKMQIFDKGFGKNTGFGLAISREILDITGITIQETGEPGKGARFEMALPPGMCR